MSLFRIYALMKRYIGELPRDLFRLFDLFFYPSMELILWGLTGLWIQQGAGGSISIGNAILVACIFWAIVEHAHREISYNITEEMYAHNLVNLLVTPARVSEWIIAVVILACMRAIFVAICCSAIAWLLFDVNITNLGYISCVYALCLLVTGISVGIFISALMIRWGRRASSLIWSISYIMLSFSAVFYPLDVLPSWIRWLCYVLPTSYIFEALRYSYATNTIAWYKITASCVLNALFLVTSLVLFYTMFARSRKAGFSS